MRVFMITVIVGLLAGLSVRTALAHEVWLAPKAYQVALGKPIIADLLNGQKFEGTDFSYNPNDFVRFERFADGKPGVPVKGRLGDTPMLNVAGLASGLHVFAYQSTASALRYETWAKFKAFIEEKGFKGVEQRHEKRGLPREKFTEVYTRFAKTLVAVGDGSGQDVATGLETEIIALANPYTDRVKGVMPVRVVYREMPRINVQVELFARAPDGQVSISRHRTDGNGEVRLPVQPGYEYLVDSVVLRQPSVATAQRSKAVWESLWASLTFKVPG